MLPATPKVLPLRATAALGVLVGAPPVDDALGVSEELAEPVLEGVPAVVLVVRVVEDEEESEVVAAASVPVGEEVVVLVELTLSSEDEVPPDLVMEKV